MFERFATESRRAIYFARQNALAAGENEITSTHLLAGLLTEPTARVNTLFKLPEKLGQEFSGVSSVPQDSIRDIPLSNDGKRILAFAAEESSRLGDYWVDTQDLLLGILREKSCTAAKTLRRAGLRLNAARQFVRESNSSQDFGLAPLGWVEAPADRWKRVLRHCFTFGIFIGIAAVIYFIGR